MLRRFAVAVASAALSAGAAAQDLPITAFAGHFVGTGLARSDLSEYFDLTVRDLDVRITPRDGGFALTWTTVIRVGDPDDPEIKRKSTAMFFVPAGRPNLFRGAPEVDPLSGRPFAWARVKDQTLTVHWLVITDDGSYEVQTYDRTLTGEGMKLEFTRVRDGEPVRSVTGLLTKEGG
ncbi:MAG: hypothetical protein ACE5LL_04350 [Alphaproteobacteria bacterium]